MGSFEPTAWAVQKGAGEQKALYLTTVALFVLLWSVSHPYIERLAAVIHHGGFWCNERLTKL